MGNQFKMHNSAILIVDDDEIDRENIKRAFEKNSVKNTLIYAKDGYEAYGILTGENGYQKLPATPLVIILDINMPKMNGFEFLRKVRENTSIHIPHVFILTTSDNEQDIIEANQYNISGYMCKPLDTNNIRRLLTTLN